MGTGRVCRCAFGGGQMGPSAQHTGNMCDLSALSPHEPVPIFKGGKLLKHQDFLLL